MKLDEHTHVHTHQKLMTIQKPKVEDMLFFVFVMVCVEEIFFVTNI